MKRFKKDQYMNGYVFKLCSIFDRRGSRNFRQRGSNLREKFDKQKQRKREGALVCILHKNLAIVTAFKAISFHRYDLFPLFSTRQNIFELIVLALLSVLVML